MELKGDKKEIQPLHLLSRNPFYKQELHGLSKAGFTHTPPKKGLSCWYCTHDIGKVCFRKPVEYDVHTDQWKVQGIYCSLNCVKTHIIDDQGFFMGRRLEYLTKLAQDVYKTFEVITCSPNRYEFVKFGGGIDYKKWYKNKALVPKMHLRGAPFVDAPLVVEYKFQDMNTSKRDMIQDKVRQRDEQEEDQPVKRPRVTKKRPGTTLQTLLDIG